MVNQRKPSSHIKYVFGSAKAAQKQHENGRYHQQQPSGRTMTKLPTSLEEFKAIIEPKIKEKSS